MLRTERGGARADAGEDAVGWHDFAVVLCADDFQAIIGDGKRLKVDAPFLEHGVEIRDLTGVGGCALELRGVDWLGGDFDGHES